jgi:TonB family protein
MIAFALAAALLLDPSPRREVSLTAPEAKVEQAIDTTVGQVPASVAVTLECTAHTDGRVDGCEVLGETHPGLGFGEAALALMRDARVAPGPREVQFAKTIQFTP